MRIPTVPIRVLLADENAVMRRGLRALLECSPDIHVIAESADATSAVRLAAKLLPDVVVVDLFIPQAGGLNAARNIRWAAYPQPRVLIMSDAPARLCADDAFHAGASGVLCKASAFEELVAAVQAVADGQIYGREVSHEIAEPQWSAVKVA